MGNLDSPNSVERNRYHLSKPFDKVWVFSSSDDVQAIVDSFIKAIRESDEIEKGIIGGIEWCINETMDNVLVHSGIQRGFIMGQLQKTSRRLTITIFDRGMGIFNSLKNSRHKPKNALDAIELALREKVTRDEKVGQGNGLWGLSQIIKENGGTLKISSCGAEKTLNYGSEGHCVESDCTSSEEKLGSTLIDFQLDYSKPIDIRKAMNGHSPIDMWIENRTLDDKYLIFDVAKDSHGTGTRQAGQKFRNVLLNSIKEKGQKIILDFSGVGIVSSSYADELIGKIIGEHGFMFFLNSFVLRNVSDVNLGIINRSVELRMAQKHYGTEMNEEE